MFLFQLPSLPEHMLAKDDYAILLRPFEELPEHARLSPAELALYRDALAQPGALTCMLNYYRALRRPSAAVAPKPIPHDVLVLWGDEDRYLRRDLAEPSPRWVPRARVEHFPGVGHFIQHERPDAVNAHLIEHFSAL